MSGHHLLQSLTILAPTKILQLEPIAPGMHYHLFIDPCLFQPGTKIP